MPGLSESGKTYVSEDTKESDPQDEEDDVPDQHCTKANDERDEVDDGGECRETSHHFRVNLPKHESQ